MNVKCKVAYSNTADGPQLQTVEHSSRGTDTDTGSTAEVSRPHMADFAVVDQTPPAVDGHVKERDSSEQTMEAKYS